MESYILYNGKTLASNTPVISADNRSLRYGDGLFETIKVVNSNIQLAPFHFERLWNGLQLLYFDIPKLFTPEYLHEQIITLCKKNKVENAARVRLNVFRGNGGLYDTENMHPNFIIQTWPLPKGTGQLNENGLVIDLYHGSKKSCDSLSGLKSNNYLPYVMAAIYAKQNQLNDALVLNQYNRACDSTIANIFWIKDAQVYTPPLSEGCVAGVMRRSLMENLDSSFAVHEKILTEEELASAHEVFLTNAIQGIRWVKQFRKSNYSNQLTTQLYHHYLKMLPAGSTFF